MSGGVFLGITSTKQGLMCLAQGHNAVSDSGEAPSPVKHSTTEPLRFQFNGGIFTYMRYLFQTWFLGQKEKKYQSGPKIMKPFHAQPN